MTVVVLAADDVDVDPDVVEDVAEDADSADIVVVAFDVADSVGPVVAVNCQLLNDF